MERCEYYGDGVRQHPSSRIFTEGKRMDAHVPRLSSLHEKTFEKVMSKVRTGDTTVLIGDYNTGKSNVIRKTLAAAEEEGMATLLLDEADRGNGFIGGYSYGSRDQQTFEENYGLSEIAEITTGDWLTKYDPKFGDKIKDSEKTPIDWYLDQLENKKVLVIIDEVNLILPFNKDPESTQKRLDFLKSIADRPNVSLLMTSFLSPKNIDIFQANFPDSVEYTSRANIEEVTELVKFHLDASQINIDVTNDFIEDLMDVTGGDLFTVNSAMTALLVTLACDHLEFSELNKSVLDYLNDNYSNEWFMGVHLEIIEWSRMFDHCMQTRSKNLSLKDSYKLVTKAKKEERLDINDFSETTLKYLELSGLGKRDENGFLLNTKPYINQAFLKAVEVRVLYELDTFLDNYLEVSDEKTLHARELVADLFQTGAVSLENITEEQRTVVDELSSWGFIYVKDKRCGFTSDGEKIFSDFEKKYLCIAYTVVYSMTDEKIDSNWSTYKDCQHYGDENNNWFIERVIDLAIDHRSLSLYWRIDKLGLSEKVGVLKSENKTFTESEFDKETLQKLLSWGIIVLEGNSFKFNLEDQTVAAMFEEWLNY